MSDWTPIPSTKSPGHGRALPVAMKAARLGLASVLVAAIVALAIVFWPLAGDGVGESGVDGIADSARFDQQIGGDRRTSTETVARLGESYLFSAGRQPLPPVASDEPSEPLEVAGPDDSDAKPVPTQPARDPGGVRVLRVESPEAVGGDVQKSFRELVLRAIHSDRTGELVALIDFTGTPSGSASVRVRPGDGFTEPKHKEADWSVVAIDPDRNRVVLERENRRLALALFGTGPADLSPVVIAPEGEDSASTPEIVVSEDGTVVVRQSPDEAIAALRREVGPGDGDQKPITFDDLAELLRAFGDLERYGERAREEQLERGRR